MDGRSDPIRRFLLGTASVVLSVTLSACGIGQATKVVVVTATPQPTIAVTSTRTLPPSPTTAPPTAEATSAPAASPTSALPKGGSAVNILDQYGPIAVAAGQKGTVDVVEVGSYDGTKLPVVVVNNTGGTVSNVHVTGEARDVTGKLIASGSAQDVLPVSVPPGKHAIGYVYFDGRSLPASTRFKLQTAYDPGSDQDLTELAVSQVNVTGNQIVGEVKNTSGLNLDGPFMVMALCFDRAGHITGEVDDYAAADKLPKGATSSFGLDLNNLPCPGYLVGARGHNPL